MEFGLADSGTTGHFCVPDANVENVRVAKHPLWITQPNGERLRSTHTCDLKIPWLPKAMRRGHIVPGLAHTTLLSIRQFCLWGATVLFTRHECRVYWKGKLVLKGTIDETTKLWVLPIAPDGPPKTDVIPDEWSDAVKEQLAHVCCSAYAIKSARARIKYLHQCLFSPPIPTLLAAIKNGQLRSWPGLTARAVQRYLAESPATVKGHMKRPRQGIRSGTKPPRLSARQREMIRDIINRGTRNPADMLVAENDDIFCCAALADRNENTVYMDMTGKFPHRSINGNQCMLVVYDYATNAILVEAIKNFESNTICEAYKKVHKYLESKGRRPRFNILDNQASRLIAEFVEANKGKYQLVEPRNHRAKAAERAIQTFKAHFIAGLCTTDANFPTQLWDYMVLQAQDTLNMLRTARCDTTKSAYEVLEGPFQFDKVLLAPPGTKAIIYDSPEDRNSWAPHGTDAWYLTPAKRHYRAARFYVPATRATRVSASARMFPQHCDPLPDSGTIDEIRLVADELGEMVARRNTNGKKTTNNELKKLKHVMDKNTTKRTSTSPTAPRVVWRERRSHNRITRNNTPGEVPIINRETYEPLVRYNVPTPKGAPRSKARNTPARRSDRLNPRMTRAGTQRSPTMLRNTKFVSNAAIAAIIVAPATAFDHRAYAGVVHPVTRETITSYRKLAADPATRDIWTHAFGKDIGNLAQGDTVTGTRGTDTIFFMNHQEISRIPKDRTVTYLKVVVDYRPQQQDPNRVRITVGGNLLSYPGELTTRTADLIRTKLLWNSVLSTKGAQYMTVDIKGFYLNTPLN